MAWPSKGDLDASRFGYGRAHCFSNSPSTAATSTWYEDLSSSHGSRGRHVQNDIEVLLDELKLIGNAPRAPTGVVTPA